MKRFQNAVVYQIYPRSFKDSDGDGIGDLPGVIEKLPYLSDLGVQAIWLSSFFASPMVDFGYDVSDYCTIEPAYGTLADFDRLVHEAHAHDIKILIDYVPNHTSDKHPWFIESRSSKDNPKRDWYMWETAPTKGILPNNWLSVFGGSGWEYDAATESYYYHSFLKEQPDLNWNNPNVAEAMHAVLRFWLKRGVDGFRMDAVAFIGKDSELRDNPLNPDFVKGTMEPYLSQEHVYDQGMEHVFDVLRGFCNVLAEYPDAFMVTEVYLPVEKLLPYFALSSTKLHAPFNMNLMKLPWSAREYRKHVEDFERLATAENVPTYVLGNHDKPRVATRVGQEKARLLALLQLTLRGMPFIYYGEELGMENVQIAPQNAKDPLEKTIPGFHMGRDPVRTPMQWTGEKYAGFSSASPWLPIPTDAQTRNVEVENMDLDSMLAFYRRLLHLRNTSPALKEGSYQSVDTENENVFAFIREAKNETMLVVLNFSDAMQTVEIGGEAEILCATHAATLCDDNVVRGRYTLVPHGGYLARLTNMPAAVDHSPVLIVKL